MSRTIAGLTAFFSGLTAGLLLGYGLGIALAPWEGTDTRRRIEREASTLRTQPREIAERARARVETAVAEGRRVAEEKRRELAAEAGQGDDGPACAARDLPV